MKSVRFMLALLAISLLVPAMAQATSAEIVRLSGEVLVRKGLDEAWQRARLGQVLEDIDTILTLETGEVTLELTPGTRFRLGSNAMLDIGDLRRITERELFLYLMEEKVGRMPAKEKKSQLTIGMGSSPRSFNQARKTPKIDELLATQRWQQEANGARALYAQDWFPNAIVKWRKILASSEDARQCAEIHYFLGKAFEAIKEPGRAIDAYQAALEQQTSERCLNRDTGEIKQEAEAAIKRLRKN